MPARVTIPERLLHLSGVQRVVETRAETVRDLMLELEQRCPGFRDALGRVAVAIDGQIFQDAFLEPIGPESEVYFLPRIEGG
jgi:molybdopterin converting factor small subunit